MRAGAFGKSLFLPLSFAVNLKLKKKKNRILKSGRGSLAWEIIRTYHFPLAEKVSRDRAGKLIYRNLGNASQHGE